jgi:hypothetical protein
MLAAMTTGATLSPLMMPTELVNAGASGHLIVLVGAGASFGAGLPSWKALLLGLLREAQTTLDPARAAELEGAEAWFQADGEELDKASLLRQVLGEDWLRAAVARALRVPDATPTATHRAIAALPDATFITTNYDDLLERAIAERTGARPRVILPTDAEGLLSFGPGDVLKLHGDVSQPASIVLSHEDYFRLGYMERAAWKKRLEALLQPPRQALLVGYGYRDFDLRDVVDALRAAYERKLPGPFWLEVETIAARSRATSAGLRPVWLAGYDRVPGWLEDLAEAIRAARAQKPAVMKLTAYIGHTLKHLEEAKKSAEDAFRAQDYEAALARYEELARKTEPLALADPEDGEIRRRLALFRLNAGACKINLGQNQEARVLFQGLADASIGDLSPQGRIALAGALAQLGDTTRARSALPPEDPALTESARASRTEALQILDLAEGRALAGEPASPLVRLSFARMLGEQGKLGDAARQARSLLDEAQGDGLLTLYGLRVLAGALESTVYEDPTTADPIPINERGDAVSVMEEGLRRCTALPLPTSRRVELFDLEFEWANLTEDDHRAEEMHRARVTEEPSEEGTAVARSKMDELGEAERLAEQGRMPEALALVTAFFSDHPWRAGYARSRLLASVGRFDEALTEAEMTAQRAPGRAPLELLLAKLLGVHSRTEEALLHARAAFSAFPVRGYRLVLGRALLQAGKADEAWQELLPLDPEASPTRDAETLELLAATAERVALKKAPALWDRYLEERPGDPAARLQRAKLSFAVGDLARVPDLAWAAWQTPGVEKLGPRALYEIGEMQRAATDFSEERRERVRSVASALAERFQGNAEAEHYRLLLLGALGFPGESAPIDYESLEREGFLRALSVDDFAAMVREQRRFGDAVYEAYRTGFLSFEALCELTAIPSAQAYAQLALASGDGPTVLCPSVRLAQADAPALDGRRLLVGELELLLIDDLRLWPVMRRALGESGRLVVFNDVVASIGRGAAELLQGMQPVALEELERLTDVLLRADSPARVAIDVPYDRDEAWAKAEGLSLVRNEPSSEGVETLSPRALARALLERGLLDQAEHAELVRRLPPEPEPRSLPEPLPERFALGFPALMAFFDAGALPKLRRLARREVAVGPEAWRILRHRRDELRRAASDAAKGAAVQRALGTGIAEGWVEARPRPDVPELPPLAPAHENEANQRLYREPLARALAHYKALEDDPALLFLTADFFTDAHLGSHVVAPRLLAWPSADAALSLRRRLRALSERVITVPTIVRKLIPGDDARRSLLRLVELGFVDALDALAILELSRRYGGADREEPARIFDRLEWMARRRVHPGAEAAQTLLGLRYAEAIWRASCDSDPPWPEGESRALAFALLGRAEVIDEKAGSAVLDRVFHGLSGRALEEPKASFEATAPSAFTLSLNTAAGRLWQAASAWAGTSFHRRSAFRRGIRHTLLLVDEIAGIGGPPRQSSSPLILAAQQAGFSTLIDGAIGALAILTTVWADRPLVEVQVGIVAKRTGETQFLRLEETLQTGADSLGSQTVVMGEDFTRFSCPVPGSARTLETEAPSEALLLRSAPGVTARRAAELADLQGALDGGAYERLSALAETPHKPNVRREVARAAVLAPWRLVREEPAVFASFEAHRGAGFPRTLPELRRMLSEPGPLPDARKRSLRALLAERVSGAWAKFPRTYLWDLLEQAMEAPGLLPMANVQQRLEHDEGTFASLIADALDIISRPDDAPAGRLAKALLFIRLALSRRPRVIVAGKEIDLREVFPGRLVALLEALKGNEDAKTSASAEDASLSEIPDPPASDATAQSAEQPPAARARRITGSTLAMLEPGLLRLSGDIVAELVGQATLPFRDGLWLTFRLHQWFCAQMDRLSPDQRSAGFQELARQLPPPDLTQAPTDALNPDIFDRTHGIDYRLITVLYAVGVAEELDPQLPEGPRRETRLEVTSAPLETLLTDLAARPLNAIERGVRGLLDAPTKFDWNGPATVPDLALLVLLALRRSAFFDLPASAQVRWLLDLPLTPKDGARAPWMLTSRILDAVARQPTRLVGEARQVFGAWLRRMSGPPESHAELMRWRGLSALYAGGDAALEEEVRSLLLKNLGSPGAIEGFAQYLMGLSATAPERLTEGAEAILSAAALAGVDPVSLLPALGRVIAASPQKKAVRAAHDALRAIAARPPFQGDSRVNDLLFTMGAR